MIGMEGEGNWKGNGGRKWKRKRQRQCWDVNSVNRTLIHHPPTKPPEQAEIALKLKCLSLFANLPRHHASFYK